jgi:tRNA dimethylallyltransferase
MTQLPIIVLVGATASGKTALLERLCAEGAPFEGRIEVVSADAMQAYRGMDIGTAKPGYALRDRIPHHLIDVCEPSEQFSVGDFVRLADLAIIDILARGRVPVVAGGTGFYVRNLVLGLPTVPAVERQTRESVAADLARLGPSALRLELGSGDPVSAARIHPNDHYRLCRAVEILRQTGRPLADFLPGGPAGAGFPAADPLTGRGFTLVEYRRNRDELALRIRARVEAMFASGLATEVAAFMEAGYGKDSPGMKAIGYSEFIELAEKGLSPDALIREARERVILDTTRYAKRQYTFFRGLARDLAASGGEVVTIEAGPGDAEALAAILGAGTGSSPEPRPPAPLRASGSSGPSAP